MRVFQVHLGIYRRDSPIYQRRGDERDDEAYSVLIVFGVGIRSGGERLDYMHTMITCQEFADELGNQFVCASQGEYHRVRTPYLYPDGDNIDIFCRPQGDITVVSDLGETTRWLRMQSVSPRRSPKQSALIEDICLTHGVEFFKGMLIARCRPDDTLSSVVFRVAQAALRVSDIWFTFRTRSVESLTDEVADFLSERQFRFARGEKLAGRSGRIWTPDFHVRAVEYSSLVYVLGTGSKAAAKGVVHQVYTAFSDLSHLNAGPEALQFISLFDDTADVWSDEDFRLAEQVSSVRHWSKPDAFAEILQAA